MPSPEHSQRWEQKEGNMKRFEFTLKEFWEKCMEPVYNADTGEQITSEKMLENKDREVLLFWAHFIDGIYGGISVKLENMDGIEKVYQDIADNRLDTWISEIPPADEIKVGDEVIYDREKCIVTAIANGEYTVMLLGLGGGYMVRTTRDEIQGKRTGRHFPEIVNVLKQMQEDNE